MDDSGSISAIASFKASARGAAPRGGRARAAVARHLLACRGALGGDLAFPGRRRLGGGGGACGPHRHADRVQLPAPPSSAREHGRRRRCCRSARHQRRELVGFGGVIAALPAVAIEREWVFSIGGGPLVSRAIATNLFSALTGSASGGLSIALDASGVACLALARPALAWWGDIGHRIICEIAFQHLIVLMRRRSAPNATMRSIGTVVTVPVLGVGSAPIGASAATGGVSASSRSCSAIALRCGSALTLSRQCASSCFHGDAMAAGGSGGWACKSPLTL